jgi:hypothetical protein
MESIRFRIRCTSANEADWAAALNIKVAVPSEFSTRPLDRSEFEERES